MPDFCKQAAKKIARDGSTDAPIAALFVRPCGDDGPGRLGAPTVASARRGGADPTDDPTRLFAHNAIVVLTEQRLVVCGHNSLTGRVGKPIGAVDLADVATMRLDRPDDGDATLTIAFADGREVRLAPGSRRQRFMDAYAALAAKATERP